jgi:hypothetical protein
MIVTHHDFIHGTSSGWLMPTYRLIIDDNCKGVTKDASNNRLERDQIFEEDQQRRKIVEKEQPKRLHAPGV